MLYKGTGKPITANSLIIAQYVAVGWDNAKLANTWTDKIPSGLDVGLDSAPSPFDSLIGVPVGSRVLLLIPAQTGQDPKTASIAAVIDIVGIEKSGGAQ